MASIFSDNISFIGKKSNFERDTVKDVAALLAVDPANEEYDYGHIVFCEEDGKHYQFNYNYTKPNDNERNDTTGYFIELTVGSVTNDCITEEKLSSELKQKRSSVLNAKGEVISMGYFPLEKKDFVLQVTDENTIYEIKYNFDLGGKEIVLPANSVLKFTGGSLSNGTIVGNNVTIESPLVKIFHSDLNFKGSFNCEFYPEWFGATTVIDENVDNSAVFNRAIECIEAMDGVHNLLLTSHYMLKDTIYLKRKTSLIGSYSLSSQVTATPEDKRMGCGFITNFPTTAQATDATYAEKYVIDCDFAKDYNVPATQMWIDLEEYSGYTWKNYRKQINLKNITIQQLEVNHSQTSGKYVFGGIRLIDSYYGIIESVHIFGVVVGISTHYSWGYDFNNCVINAGLCGFYFGKFNTIQNVSNCCVESNWFRQYQLDDVSVLGWRNLSILYPPYDEDGRRPTDEGYTQPITLKSIGIISESYDTDYNKILVNTSIFQSLDCVCLSDKGHISFNFCYWERHSKDEPIKCGLYTYSGSIEWLNPSYPGSRVYPYTVATIDGVIKIEDALDVKCYPHHTIDDKTYTKYNYIVPKMTNYIDKPIIEGGYLDDEVIKGGVVKGGLVAAKKIELPADRIYYAGSVPSDVYNFSDYQKIASGLVENAPTSFANIMDRYDPKELTLFITHFGTDFSRTTDDGSVPVLSEKIIRIRKNETPDSTASVFTALNPMRLHNSEVTFENRLSKFATTTSATIDGKYKTITLPYFFEISGKCFLSVKNYFEITYGSADDKFMTLIAGEKNEPVDVILDFSNIYVNWYDMFTRINNADNVKYRITYRNYSGTTVIENPSDKPPTTGISIGDSFVYYKKYINYNNEKKYLDGHSCTIDGVVYWSVDNFKQLNGPDGWYVIQKENIRIIFWDGTKWINADGTEFKES